MKALIAGLAILVLLVVSVTPQVRGQSQNADFSISVYEEGVSVSIDLHVSQNLTVLKSGFALPQFQILLAGGNSTNAAGKLQTGMQAMSPLAQVRDLRLEAASGAWDATSNLQWLNLSINFRVDGVLSVRGGAGQADLSWKSFAVASDVDVDGFEINNIGRRYLTAIASQIATEQTGSRLIQVSFQVNGRATGAMGFGPAVANLNTLNFSSVARSVSDWKLTDVALASTKSWSIDSRPGLGMTFIRTITEPRAEERLLYGVFYNLKGEITAPSGSSSHGDLISAVFSSFSETLMGVAILSSVSVGLGTWVYERRVLNFKSKKKPKR